MTDHAGRPAELRDALRLVLSGVAGVSSADSDQAAKCFFCDGSRRLAAAVACLVTECECPKVNRCECGRAHT